MPKVVILSPSAPPVSVGGIATAHYALYRGLQRRGFSVELVTFADFGRARFHRDTDPGISRFGSSKIWTKILQLFGRLRFSIWERSLKMRIYQTGDVWKSRAGARRINTRLRASRPDIVIFPDQASPAVWLDKLPGQHWVQVSHHQALRFVNQPEIGEHSLADALSARRLECRQFEQCDACVVPSQYMANVVRSFVSSDGKIEIISNLVDEIPADFLSAPQSDTRIFIPSGGSRFKGADVLPELIAEILRAVSNPEKIEFFISGDLSSTQKTAILQAAPQAKLTAPGHLSHAKVLENLSRSRLCVSPTWIENQSMALLEAKALGVPFVAFDVGGNRELAGFHDRVTPRGDVRALARSVADLFAVPKGANSSEKFDYSAQNETALDRWDVLLRALMVS